MRIEKEKVRCWNPPGAAGIVACGRKSPEALCTETMMSFDPDHITCPDCVLIIQGLMALRVFG